MMGQQDWFLLPQKKVTGKKASYNSGYDEKVVGPSGSRGGRDRL